MSENIIVSRKAIEQQVLENMYSLSPQADALRAILETAESAGEIERLRAELAAIKGQEPVAWRKLLKFDGGGEAWKYMEVPLLKDGEPLYALPVAPVADKDAERWRDLLADVPLPPKAITYEHGWRLLDKLQALAVAMAKGE